MSSGMSTSLGDDTRSEHELQEQIPADDPGDQLTERRVRERAGRTADRNGRSELCVAEGGEHTVTGCASSTKQPSFRGRRRAPPSGTKLFNFGGSVRPDRRHPPLLRTYSFHGPRQGRCPRHGHRGLHDRGPPAPETSTITTAALSSGTVGEFYCCGSVFAKGVASRTPGRWSRGPFLPVWTYPNARTPSPERPPPPERSPSPFASPTTSGHSENKWSSSRSPRRSPPLSAG